MKGLGQFRQFDWAGFSAGKAYQVVGVSDWLDRDTGKRLGKRVDVVITSTTHSMSIAMASSSPICTNA